MTGVHNRNKGRVVRVRWFPSEEQHASISIHATRMFLARVLCVCGQISDEVKSESHRVRQPVRYEKCLRGESALSDD